MKKIFSILIINLLCSPLFAQTLFTPIDAAKSGITFQNYIQETSTLNYFKYEYFYNGGGVAVGDINNDGLQDIYFSGNMVENKLYLNQGNLQFKDITNTAGVQCNTGFKTGVSMVDINSDGWLDIYVCKSAISEASMRKNELYINNHDGTFTNKAKDYELDDAGFSTQAYFNDMDNDGDIDMFLVNHPQDMKQAYNVELVYNKKGQLEAFKDTTTLYASNKYFENKNGKFIDKTKQAGLTSYNSFGLSAVLDDFNNDGYADIYVCNDYYVQDQLYINNKNGTFTSKGDDYFDHFSNSSMGSDYADLNNDGYLDLIVLDMLPKELSRQKNVKGVDNYDLFNKRLKYGFGYQFVHNTLQINNGNNTFSDIAHIADISNTDWSWAPLIADFDNDGLKDVYITNGFKKDVTDMDFANYKADSLKKILFAAKTIPEANVIVDIIPSVKISNYYMHNTGSVKLQNETKVAGLDIPSWSNGAAYADLDNDGDLEIIVNNINDLPFIFKNNSSSNLANHFIRFKLNGATNNPDGIGAVIEIETPDGKKQVQHYNPYKGYLSNHERFVHFGIGTNTSAKVIVTWQNKLQEIITNVTANKVQNINIKNAIYAKPKTETPNTIYKDITASTKINYTAVENDYIDFKVEPLLPKQFSKLGPCMQVADINGDKLEDVFIGGAKDVEAVIFIQQTNGTFIQNKQNTFAQDKQYEDVACKFFDADKDGDLDLLVTSGGNDYANQPEKYPVRLYTNTNGKFVRNNSFLKINTSSKSIAIADYDKDGDDDIFIAGHLVPGHYGLMPNSFLLQNNNGIFIDITAKCKTLQNIGMVTDAIWSDINNDSFKDLVLVGEWMPMTIFTNKNGELQPTPTIVKESNGLWQALTEIDINNDGKKDFIAGNIGLNTRYNGNTQYPLTMTVADFDHNGSTDCIICGYQEDGKSYPLTNRDNLLDQMTFLKKKYTRYHPYSTAQITDIFDADQLVNAKTLSVFTNSTSMFINNGEGNFTIQPLQSKVQQSQVNSILIDDINADVKPDILMGGNENTTEKTSGRNDASIGLVLTNVDGTKFKNLPLAQSGFYIPGYIKSIQKININNKPCIIIAKNEGKIQIMSKE